MNALLFALILAIPSADTVAGVPPVGKNGKLLNLDFETGTLQDWTATGEAFTGQPVAGDTVAPRRADSKSEHQGKFWIGSYEILGDKPQGTLTSVSFAVTHPWGSFLIGGGSHVKETYVEIVAAETKEMIFRASGEDSENLKRVACDLTKWHGKEIQIRIVDKHSGGWGHINFDDFRFHAEKPKVEERVAQTAVPDDYKYAGQKPEDAAKNMTVPNGFSVSLFAGEPDLHQPIAFCFDDRGRLWVVEAYTYPKRNAEPGPVLKDRKLGDKILIFEDTDGDGKFDKKTVFFEGLNLVSGIEYGFGGVWVGAAPYMLFIPTDANDKAGEPKILLDGFGYEDTHETLNGFIWGPDGWLYGCHGVFTHSNVGRPGTKNADRTPINAGIWRYHPTRHSFEVFAQGTSNPWGLDYNSHGDFFIEACVIPHLWHIVQGGRYQRQAGQHFNPYTYDDIKTIATHRHWQGANQWAGNAISGSLGGGHAHSGLLCYQGGTWPKEYHGKLFMGNIHGHRINVDVVKPNGSSYVGDRNPDFLFSHDKHCIIVGIQAGPDGNVYFSDWSDKQVCHRNEPEIWDRTNGRIFKISHKDAKPVVGLDLQKQSDEELVKLQLSDNEWMARHARRILQERQSNIQDAAFKILETDPSERNRLRAFWTLNVTGAPRDRMTRLAGADTSASVRSGGLLHSEDRYDLYEATARNDHSPLVRRTLATIAGRIPVEKRRTLLGELLAHAEDANDPVLPYLYWYALEPLCAENPATALKLAADGKIPLVFQFAARRVGSLGTATATMALVKGLSEATTAEHQLVYLRGLQESMRGKRTATAPNGWNDTYAKLSKTDNADVRQLSQSLAVKFGNAEAMNELRELMFEAKNDVAKRQAALATLLEAKDPALQIFLRLMLPDKAMRATCIRALAAVEENESTSTMLLAIYPTLSPADKRDAVATLSSRASYALALLASVEDKSIPASDIPAETIRQLRNIGDTALSAKIASVWGTIRDTPADRKKLIADWAKKLSPATLARTDMSQGRAIYAKVCAQCHTLYGTGGKVGPEITGANRADLNYLLENIFDPSAVIPKEYAATKLELFNGRVITGIIKEETKATLTVVTATETLTLAVTDIEKRTPSADSMMPNDLTKTLNDAELQALIAYLKHNQQVPISATAENIKDFFNGKDLTGWDGDKDVWSVENGEIVGKTKTGLKRNTFLKSQFDVADFRLSLKVKLTPNKENSGVQFRSVPLPDGEMRGPQADIGAGWWGKLYEESGRGLLAKVGGETLVKPDDWNDYSIEAFQGTVRIRINGTLCTDYLQDDLLARRGLIAFQVHSGGPMEVRFKELKLELLTAKPK